MMFTTMKHLHYSIKGGLEVCEEFDTEIIKQKLLHKEVGELNIKPGKMIYLDLSSQKKPSYIGSKN